MKNINKTDKVNKYRTLYMSIGMCFGSPAGLLFGIIVYPDNMTLGMCFGIPIGMLIGIAIGEAKDKRLSENMMIIRKIETIRNSTDVLIYVCDKNEVEQQYNVTNNKMKEEKFVEGDRVATEIDGSLVSLESK